jgi:hypothetical protein
MSGPTSPSSNITSAEEGVNVVLPTAAEVAVKKPQKVTVWPLFTEADINAEKWVEHQDVHSSHCFVCSLFCCRIPVKPSKRAKQLCSKTMTTW